MIRSALGFNKLTVYTCTIPNLCPYVHIFSCLGNNVKLDGAYIWDNVHIDNGCQLTFCLVDDDVHLMNNVKVQRRCVIAAKVHYQGSII